MRIEHEDIRAYFENLIFTSYRLLYRAEDGYEDIQNTTVVANESYDGKERKDIKIILKFLSGENTNGVIDLPIQVLVEVKTELQDIIFNVLQDIAYTNNKIVHTFEDKYSFKQFYNTPIVLTSFQNSGAFKSSTLTMDMRIVAFESIATLMDMTLELTLNSTSYLNNSDEMKKFKDTLLNAVFFIEHRFDGRVMKGQPLQQNKYNSFNAILTLSYILDKSSTIQEALWNLADDKKILTFKYADDNSFTEKTFSGYMRTYTGNILVSDVTKVTVELISTGA